MENKKNEKATPSEIKKQNTDFPNIPASAEKTENGDKMKKQIRETSKLNDEGKTDNTEKNSD